MVYKIISPYFTVFSSRRGSLPSCPAWRRPCCSSSPHAGTSSTPQPPLGERQSFLAIVAAFFNALSAVLTYDAGHGEGVLLLHLHDQGGVPPHPLLLVRALLYRQPPPVLRPAEGLVGLPYFFSIFAFCQVQTDAMSKLV